MNTNATGSLNPSGAAHAALLGRMLIAAMFLVVGVRKVIYFTGTAGYFAKLGFPAPEAMVALAIAIEIGGAILLIAGWRTRWVAWLLAAFVGIATASAHRFWEFDAAQYGNQFNHFFKNVAIVGGLLMLAGFGPGPRSLDRH